MTRATLLAQLAERIAAIDVPHPARIAIDGVDAAGKTTLADDLAPVLASRGREVIRASIDDFHREVAARYRRGRDSPEGYFRDSFDLPTLRARLLDPLGPGGSFRFRSKAFDYRSDQPVEMPERAALLDTILLFDGVFLQRPELSGCFELTIFLHVPFEVSVARMVSRDGSPPGVEDPGNRRYVDGQRIYLAECRPRERANLVVDNRDLQQPQLVRDDGRLAREPT